MGNEPVKRFKVGQVSASIWKNEKEKDGQKFFIFSVSIAKNYKKDDKWETTNNYNDTDLPKLALVIGKAYSWIEFEGKKKA